jgi:hypothetical protein
MVPCTEPGVMEGNGSKNAPSSEPVENTSEVVVGLEAGADWCGVDSKPLEIEDSPAQLESKKPDRLRIKIAAPPDRVTSWRGV